MLTREQWQKNYQSNVEKILAGVRGPSYLAGLSQDERADLVAKAALSVTIFTDEQLSEVSKCLSRVTGLYTLES